MLDAFPVGSDANRVEGRIKEILGGRGNEFRTLEDWQAALKTCDDMKIRLALRMVDRRIKLSGLKGIDEFAADLEKACLPPTKRTVSAFAQVYASLAHDAATHDDCERYRVFYRKYLETNGSVSEMMAWAKHYPWCELGELTNDVTWLHAPASTAARPSTWIDTSSQCSPTTRRCSPSWPAPRVLRRCQPESFDLRLERQPNGTLACTTARWRRYWGTYIEGTCQVTLTKLASRTTAVGFDEGTFEAQFKKAELADGTKVDVELTKGEFRVRRQ